MSKIIEVTVSPKGDTSIQTKGFTGGVCREASRRLEASLGIRASEQLTSEFYAVSENAQSVRQ